MKLKKYLENLEKKRIVSRAPHPALPFVLTAIIYALSFIFESLNYKVLKVPLIFLAIFALIFSILHLAVYKILTSK